MIVDNDNVHNRASKMDIYNIWYIASMTSDKELMHKFAKAFGKADLLDLLCSIVECPGMTKKYYTQGTNERTRFEAMGILLDMKLVRQEEGARKGWSKIVPTQEAKSIYLGLWDALHGARLEETLSHTRYMMPMPLVRGKRILRITRVAYEQYPSLWDQDRRLTKEGVRMELRMEGDTVDMVCTPEDGSRGMTMRAKMEDFDPTDEETAYWLKKAAQPDEEPR